MCRVLTSAAAAGLRRRQTHSEALPPVDGNDRLLHASFLSVLQQGGVGLVSVREVGQRLSHPGARTYTHTQTCK